MDVFAPYETVGAGQIPPVAGQVLDFFILYPCLQPQRGEISSKG